MDFENLEELKTLRARGVLSEEQFERHYNRMAQRVLNDRKEEARSKNGLVYLLLAYFTGTIGLHNFYAGYYKRGGVQLFLTLISFYMYYIPLLVSRQSGGHLAVAFGRSGFSGISILPGAGLSAFRGFVGD